MTDTGCLIIQPIADIELKCQSTFDVANDCASPTPTVTGAGAAFDVRPGANSQADWDNAIASMNPAGGNLVTFLPGDHPGYYVARGNTGPALSGTAANPNWVVGQPGASLTGTNPNPSLWATFDLIEVDYWNVADITVTGGFIGFRLNGVQGDASNRVELFNIDVSGTTDARMAIQQRVTGGVARPSAYIDAHCVHVHGAVPGGGPHPDTSEGLYIGTGTPLGVDETHDIRIFGIDAHDLTADGIDLKPGVTDIEIYDATIHDIQMTSIIGPVAGISILDSFDQAIPNPGNVLVERAQIWNIQADTPNNFFYTPVHIGDGNVTIRHLTEWGNQATPAVRIRPIAAVTPGMSVTIECSTAETQMLNVFDPDSLNPAVTEQCNILADGSVDFVGPTVGLADAGYGPGSGFTPTNAPAGTCCTTDSAGCPSDVAGAWAAPQQGWTP